MKVCIFDIKRFALHDGPGIRTTVFFKGCPLECRWCHNPEGIRSGTERFTEEIILDGVSMEKELDVGRWVQVEDLMDELGRDRVYMEESGGGISFSGGEPLLQAEGLISLLELSKEQKIHTAVDTSGYAAASVMKSVSGLADLILYDLKTLDNEKHREYTGVSNRKILDNLDIALGGPAEIIIRIPLVTGFNDQPGELNPCWLTCWAGVNSGLLIFFPTIRMVRINTGDSTGRTGRKDSVHPAGKSLNRSKRFFQMQV